MEPEVGDDKPTSFVRLVYRIFAKVAAVLSIAILREIIGLIIIVAIVVLALGIKDYLKPRAGIFRGAEVTQEHVKTANGAGALNPGETIDCFYQADGKETDEWFCMVTDQRVVLYDKSNLQSPITAIGLNQILLKDINQHNVGMIYIMGRDGTMIHLVVSSEDRCDEKLFEAITDGMKSVGNDPWQKIFEFEWSF